MPNNKDDSDKVNYPSQANMSFKDHGIDRRKSGGYDAPYVDLDGWKLGPKAPKHRSRGEKTPNRPKVMVKPGEDYEEMSYKEKGKLYDRPYNWHDHQDWVAKLFRGLYEQKNHCTSIFHHYKNKAFSMSDLAKKQQRRRKVAQLLLEGGYTQKQMAEMIGVAQSTIHNDCKVLDKIWREEMAQSVDTFKARVKQRLSYVMRESKEAWERSKLKKVKEKTKTKKNKKGNTESEEITVSEEDLIGDPRFLENFKEAAIDIALFQGVEKQDSTKFEVTIMPPLPEEKFGRYGITSEDYDNQDDSNDLDNVKMRLESNEKERLQQEQVRLQAKSVDVEDAEFEEIEDEPDK